MARARASPKGTPRMSMMARFVAITADRLAMIKDNPDSVEAVFTPDAGLPFKGAAELIERLRRHAPRLVADALERMPHEQQLQQRLGLGKNGLPNSGVGNTVPSQLAQR